MNINFLFTFLGEHGGIPVLEEEFLTIAEEKNGGDDIHFSLATYDRNKTSAKLPTLIIKRGEMVKNIFRYRQFLKEHEVNIIFYHYHTFPLFLCGKRYIIEIHDTNPLSRLPALVATTLNALFATGILVPSESTRERLTRVFSAMGLGLLRHKISVAPNPIPHLFEQELMHPDLGLLQRFSLTPKQYLFTVGADDIDFICQCATQATSLPLVIGGTMSEMDQKRIKDTYGTRIVFSGFVDRPTLAALYAGANAVLYKNANEGFGYIPIEAAMAGTPVITNPDASIYEILGAAGFYYKDAEECITLIKKASLNTPPHRQNNFKQYSAETVFEQHIALLKRFTYKKSAS